MTWIDYRTTKEMNYSRDKICEYPQHAIVDLTAEQSQLIYDLAVRIAFNPYIREEQEQFINAAKQLANYFPDDVKKHIKAELETGIGSILIRGLPVDKDLPATPIKGGALEPNYKTTFIAEVLLLALGDLTGAEVFNFRQEGLGAAPLIDNIVPIKKLQSQKGAGGFDNNFPFHCESAWHRKRPDYLILLGVREASDAKTLVFSSAALKGLDENHILRKNRSLFRFKAPDLYVQMEKQGIPLGTNTYSLLPPIEFNDSGIGLNINFNGTDCASDDDVEWLRKLEDFIEENTVGTIISAGNALLINNRLTCHTRTGYTPTFDGMDRWFLRGYFQKSLWNKEAVGHHSETHIAPEDFNDMLRLGWISPDGELTSEFSKYVYHPEEIKKLTGRAADLSRLACFLTPIKASRIV